MELCAIPSAVSEPRWGLHMCDNSLRFFFELIRTVMGLNSLAGLFFFLKLQISFWSFLNHHHQTTANASTATNNTTKTTHTNTNTNTNTDKNTDTDTDTDTDTSFQVARGLHRFLIRTSSTKQGMSQSTGTLTLWQVRAVCTQRESPTGRVIIVIVAERGERRQEWEERREREKEREENPSSPPHHHHHPLPFPPLCVYAQDASVYAGKTRACACFAGTHGCVLNAHTEAF